MKKIFTALLILTPILWGLLACAKAEDDTKTIVEFSSIPAAAQAFTTTHFEGIEPFYIEKSGGSYRVTLKNNTLIVFSDTGDWTKVACYGDAVPTSIVGLLPEKITTFIKEGYKAYRVTDLSKESYGYKLSLRSPVTELKFDINGTKI